MTDKPKSYDLIIIGAGPAGLTAAIYGARRSLKTLVATKQVGGLMIMTHQVENFPGFEEIPGYDLMDKFKKQAEKFGTDFKFFQAQKIKKNKEGYSIIAEDGKQFLGRAIILSFGLSNRRLNVPGEEELKGRGVNYCATCDGPLYKGKTVAVIGGGNSAMESAEYLSHLVKKVYLLNRSDGFRAESQMLKRVRSYHNVEIICNAQVKEIKGDKKVSGLIVYDSRHPEKVEELAVEGIFIEIGYEPKTDWLKEVVDLNERGEIIVDKNGATSAKGIFAAGDCTDSDYKQIVIAAGAGAKASLEAYKYIVAHSGYELEDWGKCESVGAEKIVKIKLDK